jgi:hypothetical protein
LLEDLKATQQQATTSKQLQQATASTQLQQATPSTSTSSNYISKQLHQQATATQTTT